MARALVLSLYLWVTYITLAISDDPKNGGDLVREYVTSTLNPEESSLHTTTSQAVPSTLRPAQSTQYIALNRADPNRGFSFELGTTYTCPYSLTDSKKSTCNILKRKCRSKEFATINATHVSLRAETPGTLVCGSLLIYVQQTFKVEAGKFFNFTLKGIIKPGYEAVPADQYQNQIEVEIPRQHAHITGLIENKGSSMTLDLNQSDANNNTKTFRFVIDIGDPRCAGEQVMLAFQQDYSWRDETVSKKVGILHCAADLLLAGSDLQEFSNITMQFLRSNITFTACFPRKPICSDVQQRLQKSARCKALDVIQARFANVDEVCDLTAVPNEIPLSPDTTKSPTTLSETTSESSQSEDEGERTSEMTRTSPVVFSTTTDLTTDVPTTMVLTTTDEIIDASTTTATSNSSASNSTVQSSSLIFILLGVFVCLVLIMGLFGLGYYYKKRRTGY